MCSAELKSTYLKFRTNDIRDPSLNDVFDLDYGQIAERDFIGDRWTRLELDNEGE